MSQGSVFSSLSECQTPLSTSVSRVPEQSHMAEPTPAQVCAGLSGHGPTNETVCDPWPCAPADAIGSFVRLACVRVRGAAGAVWPCTRVGESPALSAAPDRPPLAAARWPRLPAPLCAPPRFAFSLHACLCCQPRGAGAVRCCNWAALCPVWAVTKQLGMMETLIGQAGRSLVYS